MDGRVTWTQSRVLITGATGFIGQRISARLIESGAQVIGLGNVASEATVAAGVRPWVADVTDRAAMMAALAEVRPTHVLHLAAVGVTDPFVPIDYAEKVNVTGTRYTLEASAAVGVRRLVHVGTAYEKPAIEAAPASINPYVATKLAAWRLWREFVQATGLNSVAVRLFHVYGPGQPEHGLILAAIKAALAQSPMRMTAGEQHRDFVYIDDVVDGLMACLAATDHCGETLDLGTGTSRSVRDAVQAIFQSIGQADTLKVELQAYRPHEFMTLRADPEPIAHAWGWRARTSFEAGVAATIDWYRQCSSDR
ncbi:MAG: NAD(P)-dependent oxidoreductase [Thermoflexales bacterium]|nr:NAD(P)-dependent oxidoreductase [Thermoflexales bacterium]